MTADQLAMSQEATARVRVLVGPRQDPERYAGPGHARLARAAQPQLVVALPEVLSLGAVSTSVSASVSAEAAVSVSVAVAVATEAAVETELGALVALQASGLADEALVTVHWVQAHCLQWIRRQAKQSGYQAPGTGMMHSQTCRQDCH
jgi:hypothetical protein